MSEAIVQVISYDEEIERVVVDGSPGRRSVAWLSTIRSGDGLDAIRVDHLSGSEGGVRLVVRRRNVPHDEYLEPVVPGMTVEYDARAALVRITHRPGNIIKIEY